MIFAQSISRFLAKRTQARSNGSERRLNSLGAHGLTFVTQSPNDLPDDVLGLVNNWVIYKIDEATIRRLKSYRLSLLP
jgi:DNA helicase HerA-like ATPase